MEADIIVIGAGAAGLWAARELGQAGQKVLIIEAKPVAGGRVHTIIDEEFSSPVEAGAEFVHGDLPLTLQLLMEAGIEYHETGGTVWRKEKHGLEKQEGFLEDAGELKRLLEDLQEDMTVAAFIRQYLADEKYADMRQSIVSFVQGYDAADIEKASAFTLRDELSAEDEPQYRIKEGYTALIEYLAMECDNAGCRFVYDACASAVEWKEKEVKVTTRAGDSFSCKQLVITVPLGVIEEIRFKPSIPGHFAAAKRLGYGSVIKFAFEFNKPFWEEQASKMGFVFSDETVPTWWTHTPERSTMLTGWLAGPGAEKYGDATDADLKEHAVSSLASIFGVEKTALSGLLKAWKVFNWHADPHARGAYSYATVNGNQVRALLAAPIAGTLFFAGEGVYIGPYTGTVEAALHTGLLVSREVLRL